MSGPAPTPAADAHRAQVGGMFDEIGRMQLEFLKSQGLVPGDRMLDVGCGCLRGGVHFVGYLAPGNYYGIDLSPDLIRAGLEIEIPRAGLRGRLAPDHLLVNGAFEVSRFGVTFDVAWAQSVFTHLPSAPIGKCLAEVARCMRPGGRFFATFFESGADPSAPVVQQPGGHTTYPDRDPFHYRFADLASFADPAAWRVTRIGDWGHPRAQRMARFDRI
jgi:SAM-dependent methyltransferase